MAIHDVTATDPLLKQRPPPGDEPPCQPFHLIDGDQFRQAAREHAQLPDVSLPPGPHPVRAALRGDLRAARRRRVPGREHPRHLPQRALDGDPGPHERGQSPRGRHPPHHHQMVTYPATGTVDGGHPQVHVGREPPIQLYLAAAGRRPRPGLREVEETEIDRLLQLVSALTHEEDHGRMRLRHRGVSLAHPAFRRDPRRLSPQRRQRRHLRTRPGHLPAPPACDLPSLSPCGQPPPQARVSGPSLPGPSPAAAHLPPAGGHDTECRTPSTPLPAPGARGRSRV